VHSSLPVLPLYLPATHTEHGQQLGPVNPRLQTQLVCAVDAITDCEFAGHARQVISTVSTSVAEYVLAQQSVHMAGPIVSLYFPATHTVHTGLLPCTQRCIYNL
jgi:hypothetical protein